MAAASLLIVALFAAAGQAPAPPNQPAASAAVPAATGAIRGHVIAADTGQPLRRAQVRLVSMAPAAAQNRENRSVMTDADGAYEFANLAAGRYQVMASKGTYIQLSYEQKQPDDPLKPVQLAAGQILERVDLRLPRGAVLTGRVVDEFGDPLSNIQVSVVRSMWMNGGRRLMNTGRVASTDDLGEFRLFGVAPCDCYIEATWRSQSPPPAPGARAEPSTGYAQTYFPGTEDAGKAQKFSLKAGDVVSELVFAMVAVKTATISGRVTNSRGQPVQGGVMLQRQGGAGMSNAGTGVRPDGSFVLVGVAPGSYTLRAQPSGPDGEVALLDIAVAGEDIADVQLVTAPPSTISGRVAIDAAATAPAPQLTLMAMPSGDGMFGGPLGQGRVADDGTFELRARAGRNLISMTGGGGGMWQIKSVRVGGVDVTDAGIEVKPNQNVDRVEIEITNRVTTVSGMVTDARGEPASGRGVVAFPQDRARWNGSARAQRMAGTDNQGRYTLSGLAPGSYYIAAIERIDYNTAQDPDFLERLIPRATAFTVIEAETRTVDLRLVQP